MLTTFERVKLILDQLCPQVDAVGGQAQARMKAFFCALDAEYPLLWDGNRSPVDYGDPACHAAYIFKYVTANAELIYQSLWQAREELAAILSHPVITVICVGGGPGTELFALFKYLERMPHHVKAIKCIVLDHNPAWAAAYEALLATRPAGVDVAVELLSIQLADPSSIPIDRIVEADLLTFSYSLSESWRYNGPSGGAVDKSVQAIISAVKPGALIVYSDNAGPHFDPNMEREFLGRVDLRQINRTDYTHMLVGADEQMDTLKEYKTWLDMRPKLTGKATTAVFAKL